MYRFQDGDGDDDHDDHHTYDLWNGTRALVSYHVYVTTLLIFAPQTQITQITLRLFTRDRHHSMKKKHTVNRQPQCPMPIKPESQPLPEYCAGATVPTLFCDRTRLSEPPWAYSITRQRLGGVSTSPRRDTMFGWSSSQNRRPS